MLLNATKCWNGGKVKLNTGKFFPNVRPLIGLISVKPYNLKALI